MLVNLPSEITLSHIAEIRDRLLQALGRHEAIELDAQAVTEIDVVGLQLLSSLRRSASKQNIPLTILGVTPDSPIAKTERRAGFARPDDRAPASQEKEKPHG